MASLDHPTIGQVRGNRVGNVAQFLGIKFASLKDRFAAPALATYSGAGLDATSHGPQALSPPGAVDMEFGLIQQALPKPSFPGVSDLEGLNLNISTPLDAPAAGARYPVLVFIHGGGFGIGGNWWPQYDCAKIVALSISIGKPIIAININYRLGAPGLMTSPELREAGYKPNNSIRYQWTALEWVRTYIGGFGGDSENVTVSGESAGAVSAAYVLLSKQPLAKRILSLGGLPPFMGQIPEAFADSNALKVQAALGIEANSSSSIVPSLVNVPAEDLLQKVPPTMQWAPVLDGEIMRDPVSLGTLSPWDKNALPGTQFVDAIMVASSKLDASIAAFLGLFQRKAGIAAAFRASAAQTLSAYPDALKTLLEHYSLSETLTASMSDDEALGKVLVVLTDLLFQMPAAHWAASFPKDAFVIRFDEPNPWDGPFRGQAGHVLDVAFLFQNYNHLLSDAQRASAVAFATDVISFVSGEKPWKPYSADSASGEKGDGARQRETAVYANGGRTVVSSTENETLVLALSHTPGGPSRDELMKVGTDFLSH